MHRRSCSRERHSLRDEVAVVDDVVMGQRRALRQPVVPLVNWMLIASSGCSCGRSSRTRSLSSAVPLDDARLRSGESRRADASSVRIAARSSRHLRPDLFEHRRVVAGLEARREHERLAADFVEGVFELGGAIGRIDGDEDQPGLGGRELGDDPFVAVRRPDADPIAGHEPEVNETGCQAVGRLVELADTSSGCSDGERPAPRARPNALPLPPAPLRPSCRAAARCRRRSRSSGSSLNVILVRPREWW